MDSFFYRFRNPLVLIAIVLVQVIALAMQVQRPLKVAEVPASARTMESGAAAPDGKHVSLLRRWTVTSMTPIETAVHTMSLRVRDGWDDYVNLRHTRAQDAALKNEVARLRVEEASFAEDAAQGRRLQKLLAFKEQYVTTTVAAQVIGTSGSERSHVLYLDKGSDDGLKPEQAVITPDGVVGKIRDVFPHTSQLLLISDPSSGAGVILATTRIRGIVRGTATGQVEINNLTADSRIKVGEPVVTSGGDLVFPRGLPVGTVESIAPDPLHQPYTAILIKPAANLSRLEEVLVITGTSPTLTAQGAADADAAEATADANQKAADLIAEKLPSVDTNAAGTPETTASGAAVGTVGPDGQVVSDDPESQVGAKAGFVNSGLPRPKPVIHPDKYTPGAAPPATDLTPGGPSEEQTPVTQGPTQDTQKPQTQSQPQVE
ncbi:MAG: rod shape-determining protein MreC [Acidobacteriaceae bacterium]